MPITIDAAFPGGNVGEVRFLSGREIEFSAAFDASPQSLWYYFRVRGAAGQRLLFHQTGLAHVLGVHESNGYGPVAPVVYQKGAWTRVPDEDILFSEEPPRHSFFVDVACGECFVAFCYPYQWADFERLYRSLPPEYLRYEVLGTTKEGRPYPCVCVTAPGETAGRTVLGFLARTHAGEVSGSFVMEGLATALTSGAAARSLLQKTVFVLFPMVDLDSVEAGRYGKDRMPADYNRDWSARPYHEEIGLIQQKLLALQKEHRMALFFDLHAPQPGAGSYMPPNTCLAPYSGPWEEMWRFGALYEALCQERGLPFRLKDVDTEVLDWGGVQSEGMAANWFHQVLRCPYFCFEYSYHRAGGLLMTPALWRRMGEALLDACVQQLDAAETRAAPRQAIPAWAVPAIFGAWRQVDRAKNMEVRQTENRVVLVPQEKDNHVWLITSRRFAAQEGTVLAQLTAPAGTVVYTRLYFYAQGAYLAYGREAAHYLDGAPLTIAAQPYPAADTCALCVRVERSPGTVAIALQ